MLRLTIAVRLFTELRGRPLINKYRDGGVGISVCIDGSKYNMIA